MFATRRLFIPVATDGFHLPESKRLDVGSLAIFRVGLAIPEATFLDCAMAAFSPSFTIGFTQHEKREGDGDGLARDMPTNIKNEKSKVMLFIFILQNKSSGEEVAWRQSMKLAFGMNA